MSILKNEYQKLKKKYPDAIIWFSINGFVECISECAIKTSDTLGLPLTNRSDNGLKLCGFSCSELHDNLKKMVKSRFTVALIDRN